jgi:GDPmannose 4,6-dehydratase
MKNALISGITGQDGAYLSKFLLDKKYNVFGMYRRASTPNFWRLQALDVFDQISLIPSDVTDTGSIMEAITISEPDEIYNLAAQSFVGASFEKARYSTDVNGLGPVRFLETIRVMNDKIKFYQASTSEMFGNTTDGGLMLNEDSTMKPISPYAASKLYGFNSVCIYREGYDIYAVNGILFNHESPLRGLEFVTRKVTNEIAKIVNGLSDKIVLGDMNSKRDWGYAPEYVEAMWKMLQQDTPDDFVISTGETHSVEELVDLAFRAAGINNYGKYIKTNKQYYRPTDINVLIGDASKANKILDWKAKIKFKELIELMVKSDISNWSKYLDGNIFPWDAPNYPSEANILTRVIKH